MTSMVRELKTGVFGSLDLSDIGIIVLGATYAGVLVILIVSRFYCEGVRYTSPSATWVEFSVSGLSWDFWGLLQLELQLEVASFQLDAIEVEYIDLWRVCRPSESAEWNATWLMGIFMLLCSRCRGCRGNEMRFSPLARGCSSSTSRWEGTIWDEIQHTPRLSASSEAEVKQRSHHVKLASKWRRIGAHLCCDYTGMGPGNMHSLTNMAITVSVFMCIRGSGVRHHSCVFKDALFHKTHRLPACRVWWLGWKLYSWKCCICIETWCGIPAAARTRNSGAPYRRCCQILAKSLLTTGTPLPPMAGKAAKLQISLSHTLRFPKSNTMLA